MLKTQPGTVNSKLSQIKFWYLVKRVNRHRKCFTAPCPIIYYWFAMRPM